MQLNTRDKGIYWNSFIPGIITFSILFLFFYFYEYAPFGNNSLATMDANIMYLDFFAYLKDVFEGQNSIFYSFSKVLGGNTIGVFSYYLSSPFNFLLLFFKKTDLVSFFDITVSLKLSLAAVTCSVFLKKRFHSYIDNVFKHTITVLLSVSYALSQYSIAQSSNILWLDGVYMLPMILFGVYTLISTEKVWVLSLSVAASIIFNWYTGAINCIFASLWFLFEFTQRTNKSYKDFMRLILLFIYSMMSGVLISCFLFLPTFAAIKNSTRGNLEFNRLFDFSFKGNPVSVLEGYSLGAKSTKQSVSLFCGSLALIGCLFSVTGESKSGKKLYLIAFLGISTILLPYWNVFYGLFSLLKSVGSYWCRYSYICIMTIIFTAAYFYTTEEIKISNSQATKSVILYVALLLTIIYCHNPKDEKYIIKTLEIIFIMGFIIISIINSSNNRPIRIAFLIFIFLCETAYGTKLLINHYHTANTKEFFDYTSAIIPQIEALKNYDNSIYRISQTTPRRKNSKTGLTANYNEALAYNYWSNSGYTSSPDDITRNFLERLGYRKNGENMNIVNTSIIAADSLLGIKYVLSPDIINGLIPLNISKKINNTSIYKNPYYLPMAFKYNAVNRTYNNKLNAFEYQNELYSELTGEHVELYEPLNYSTSKADKKITYTINIPRGNYAVYGNLPWGSQFKGNLNVNNSYTTNYACWLSPSVFYIPNKDNNATCTVTLTSSQKIQLKDEQFYALNLNLLDKATTTLKAKSAKAVSIQNGLAIFSTEGKKGENLYISIPYDRGWFFELNGKEIYPSLFADCMYSIPLENGKNIIKMKYHATYLKAGVICTILGLIATAIYPYFISKSFKKNT